jgi:hypothetical protein
VTARRGRRRLALACDGILGRGGTPYHIATRLHVSGTTARALTAPYQSVAS